jgi:type I restriction enzyme S subunit
VRNEQWRWRPLGELFEIGSGKTMSAAARTGLEKTPFLRTSNVLWDDLDLSQVDEMAIAPRELVERRVRPGDLLVCEGGEVGRAAIWNGEAPIMSFQNHIHRLRPTSADVEPRFYVYFLQCAFTQLGIFEGAGNNTTIPNLSRSRLAALEIPQPPREEQQAVSQALAHVRSALKLQSRLIAISTELKVATMRELYMRGLRGEAQKETEIGLLPKSWDVTRLGSLGHVGNGSTPKRSISAYWDGGTYPWLTSAKVYDREIVAANQFVTETALRDCHLPRINAGAVLIAITGQGKTLGHSAVLRFEATINQHIAYVAVDPKLADPSFVRGYLETQYEYLRQVGSGGGSTKGALTCAFLRDLPIPQTDPKDELREQHEIVAVLDAIDKKIDLHRRKRVALEDLFKALLHKLMTGAIRVADLDLSALRAPTADEASS